MKHTSFPAVLLLALAMALPLTARAATLLSNVGQTHLLRGATPDRYGEASSSFATDFLTTTQAATVTAATFYLVNSDGTDHTYTASIYTDAAGLPGTLVGSFDTFLSPGNFTNTTEVSYSVSSPGISLAANTKYWMALTQNEVTVFGLWTPHVVQTSSLAADAGSVFSYVSSTNLAFKDDVTPWTDTTTSVNMVFSLTGVVPEPSRALLAGLGLAGLVLRRRRAV